jgi:hypothetical protein
VAEQHGIRERMPVENEFVADPKKLLFGLMFHRFPWVDAGVHAEEWFHKIVTLQRFEKLKVILRYPGADFFGGVVSSKDAIAGQGCSPTVEEEHLPVSSGKTKIGEKHILVIAFEKDHFPVSSTLPIHQIGYHPLRVRTSVNIVAEKDQPIHRFERQGFQ